MRNTARQTRENRTITVDFRDEATYFQLLGDGKAFIECVLAFLLALGFQLAHKATCRGGGCLTRHSHYARVRLEGVARADACGCWAHAHAQCRVHRQSIGQDYRDGRP
jgi:hypothetical protein